jgi:hypothetical protein
VSLQEGGEDLLQMAVRKELLQAPVGSASTRAETGLLGSTALELLVCGMAGLWRG